MSLTCSFYCDSTRCRFRLVDQPEFRMISMVDAAPRRRSSWMVFYWSTEITTHLEKKTVTEAHAKASKVTVLLLCLAHLGTNAGLCDSCHHWCLAQNHHSRIPLQGFPSRGCRLSFDICLKVVKWNHRPDRGWKWNMLVITSLRYLRISGIVPVFSPFEGKQ